MDPVAAADAPPLPETDAAAPSTAAPPPAAAPLLRPPPKKLPMDAEKEEAVEAVTPLDGVGE